MLILLFTERPQRQQPVYNAMTASEQVHGSHTTPSSCGAFIAYTSNDKLRVRATDVSGRFVQFAVRAPSKDVIGLRWNDDRTKIAVLSAQIVEVVDLDDAKHRVVIDNGGGGMGRFSLADFVAPDRLLIVWEFGKANIWGLSASRAIEIGSVKTTYGGRSWQRRPAISRKNSVAGARVLATLSRPGAEDLLTLHFTDVGKSTAPTALRSVDARSLSWSPDGSWLAILDAPTAVPSVHFYTSDGHHFRSYPQDAESGTSGLEVKSLVWSPDSRSVALTRYDKSIVLLNAKLFTPLAIIEHTRTIDLRSKSSDLQAPIFQETVSAGGARSYNLQPQPFSPPPTIYPTITSEHSELGTVEARFSEDGNFLATRHEGMVSTVWIWSIATLNVHAVLVQHASVRRMQWHPTQHGLLLINCGGNIAHIFDAKVRTQPSTHAIDMQGAANLSWLFTGPDENPVVMASNKVSFRLAYPFGALETTNETREQRVPPGVTDDREKQQSEFDEGASEDSLLDFLSGRTPLPPKNEQSYTERVDVEVDMEDAYGHTRLQDTFRGVLKSNGPSGPAQSPDPLDDSEIF